MGSGSFGLFCLQDTDFDFLEADVKWVYRPGVDLHDADPMSVQLSKGSDFKARLKLLMKSCLYIIRTNKNIKNISIYILLHKYKYICYMQYMI